MPIYEYSCEACNERFDLFVRSTKKHEEPKCPHCGSSDVNKAVSLFGVGGSGSEQLATSTCGPGPI